MADGVRHGLEIVDLDFGSFQPDALVLNKPTPMDIQQNTERFECEY
jgi:hypothetical protein